MSLRGFAGCVSVSSHSLDCLAILRVESILIVQEMFHSIHLSFSMPSDLGVLQVILQIVVGCQKGTELVPHRPARWSKNDCGRKKESQLAAMEAKEIQEAMQQAATTAEPSQEHHVEDGSCGLIQVKVSRREECASPVIMV